MKHLGVAIIFLDGWANLDIDEEKKKEAAKEQL